MALEKWEIIEKRAFKAKALIFFKEMNWIIEENLLLNNNKNKFCVKFFLL